MAKEDESKVQAFFRRIGQAILNVGKLPGKVKKPSFDFSKNGSEGEIPSFLKGFFRDRHAGWPEYVILKLQISLLFLFISAVVFSISFNWTFDIFSGLVVLFISIYTIYLLYWQIKKAFSTDFSAYRSFVFIVFIIVLEIVIIGRLGILDLFYNYNLFLIFFVVLGTGLGLFIAFRYKYGRDYTFATVLDVEGSKVEVETHYDIRSNVKNGTFYVETETDVKKGDRVKLKVDRPFIGLKGSKPTHIIKNLE